MFRAMRIVGVASTAVLLGVGCGPLEHGLWGSSAPEAKAGDVAAVVPASVPEGSAAPVPTPAPIVAHFLNTAAMAQAEADILKSIEIQANNKAGGTDVATGK